jgi:hypothetical protein
VDRLASFLSRASEVESIGGTEESRGWKSAESPCGRGQQRVVHGAPLPQAAGAIGLELIAQQVKPAHIHHALAQFAVKHGDDFRLADEQAADLCFPFGKGDDARAVRLREIEFCDGAGVEIDHRPSRISEMICVLSVPPESFA